MAKLERGQTIVVDISPAGNVDVEAHGFAGCGCADATKNIELVLGGGQQVQTKKPEFYAPNTGGGVRDTLKF